MSLLIAVDGNNFLLKEINVIEKNCSYFYQLEDGYNCLCCISIQTGIKKKPFWGKNVIFKSNFGKLSKT